jgi:LacI family transcriptional regulator
VGTTLDEALTRELTAFEETGGRVVIVSQHELPFDTVQINNYQGAKDLANDLVAHGYRRFAAITGIGSLMTSRDRLSGFLAGLAEHDITIADDHLSEAEFTREGGYEAAGRLIERGHDDIDLIFAVNDVMAIGVMSRLREVGIDVPGTIGVAGFDDISTARDVTPALSTVHLPLEQVGAAAIELALRPRTGPEHAVVTIDGTVVLRASSPPHSAR